jgi:hypothetical protein
MFSVTVCWGRLHMASMTRWLQIAGPTARAAMWNRLSPTFALLQTRHIRGCTQLPPEPDATVQCPNGGDCLASPAPRRPGCA